MITAQRTIPSYQAPSAGFRNTSAGFGNTAPTPSPSVPVSSPTPSPSSGMAAPEPTSGLISADDQFSGILGDTSLIEIIQKLIVVAFIIAGLLSAIFIFVGGISFILSGGNDEKIKKAVNTIRYAIVGLIVTIFSFTFVTIVGRFFGLNLLDYISWDMIKQSIEDVAQGAKQQGISIPKR